MNYFNFNDDGALLEKAEECFDKELYEEAILFLNRAFSIKETPKARILYAKLYYDIGSFNYALQKCYEIRLSKDVPANIRYENATLLFKIFFLDDRYDLADMYYTEIKAVEAERDFVFKDIYEAEGLDSFLDYYRDEYNVFSVLDKYEEAEKEILNETYLLMSAGKYSEAVKLLKKDGSAKISAQKVNMLILCYINLHKYKLAESLALDLLRGTDTFFQGVLNMINIAIFKRDAAMREKYIKTLRGTYIGNEDDLEKAKSVMMVAGCHEMVEKYSKELLASRPYDVETMYHWAASLYNQDKREEAKAVYKCLYDMYGPSCRAQFFLKYADKGMKVYYNAPLPFEYFKLLSALFESISNGADINSLFKNPENRELLYLSLMIDELQGRAFIYLMLNMENPEAEALLKRFFMDIIGNDDFKEAAARNIVVNGKPFEFKYITRFSCGEFIFDGKNNIAASESVNSAYAHLLTRLLFQRPQELKSGVEGYVSYFVTVDDILSAGTDVSDLKAVESKKYLKKNYKALAAAVYYKVNYMQKNSAETLVGLFLVRAAALKKALKHLDELFQSKGKDI